MRVGPMPAISSSGFLTISFLRRARCEPRPEISGKVGHGDDAAIGLHVRFDPARDLAGVEGLRAALLDFSERPGEVVAVAGLQAVAGQLGLKADITIRVNPDVDAKTHPYISTGLKVRSNGMTLKTNKMSR